MLELGIGGTRPRRPRRPCRSDPKQLVAMAENIVSDAGRKN